MLTIFCNNKERLDQCKETLCCCECNKVGCPTRCVKELAVTCEEFEEDFD